MSAPALDISAMLPDWVSSQILPVGSAAMKVGINCAAAPKPVDGESGAPALENSATRPDPTAHTFPEASMAMLEGTNAAGSKLNPPPMKPLEGESGTPALESFEMLLFWGLVTHALPASSMAMLGPTMPMIPSKPPPVKPLVGESDAPELASLVTPVLALLVIHTLPEPSMATPEFPAGLRFASVKQSATVKLL